MLFENIESSILSQAPHDVVKYAGTQREDTSACIDKMVSTSSVAGVVAGANPLDYSSGAPYTIFLFQAIFILILCALLHFPLKRIRQPRVIAEVLCGILLGPSVMGHIPNFTKLCFPTASIPGLTLFANIGIILFLFIIGMEVDLTFIKKNARAALSVGFVNMAVPFALGCGIAKGLYTEYRIKDSNLEPIKFTTYMVFIAVAMCITAFPVLARILVDLNLIGDRVGTIVLAAGVLNDLTGWILLALSVTLTNAESGVNTVYILLLVAGWTVFLGVVVRWALRAFLSRFTNDLTTGMPSQMLMIVIIVLVFTSAFYTDIIGVHPIFGAFMVGVIIPRDNGYVVRITEKLEDLVHVVMIPVYFAIAGLNVNLSELNRKIDWAYTIGITLLALVGKITGGFAAAKLNGLLWRESLSVGVLMSCKGIVEIVVLNVGLNSNILLTKVYSMFVVMTLVTTFLTTPLALWTYPESYREKVARQREDKEQVLAPLLPVDLTMDSLSAFKPETTLLLKNVDAIPHLMALLRHVKGPVQALHLREFTARTSDLLDASAGEETTSSPILEIVHAFSVVLGVSLTTRLLLVPLSNYAATVNGHLSANTLLLTCCTASSAALLHEEEEQLDLSLTYLFDNILSHVAVLAAGAERTMSGKRLHLVLNQHDVLSSSDVLALYMASLFAPFYELVVVDIKGSASAFATAFRDHLRTTCKTEISVNMFSDVSRLGSKSLEGDMFVIAAKRADEQELLRMAAEDMFDVLFVKAKC